MHTSQEVRSNNQEQEASPRRHGDTGAMHVRRSVALKCVAPMLKEMRRPIVRCTCIAPGVAAALDSRSTDLDNNVFIL